MQENKFLLFVRHDKPPEVVNNIVNSYKEKEEKERRSKGSNITISDR